MNFQPRPILPAAVEVGAPPTKCCCPLWNDQERATHKYCGEKVAKERSYCAQHCAIALVPSGGGRFKPEDFGGKAAPQPRVLVKVNKPKPVAKPKQRHTARKITNAGKAPFARTLPPIDIRLCANERERGIVMQFNCGASHRTIAAAEAERLGKKVSNNVIAGTLNRIRKREVPE